MTEEDVKNAEKIFGKDISALKGKTTRSKPVPVKTDTVAIPRALKVQHQKIELCADIMFVQNIPFLQLSRNKSATELPRQSQIALPNS